MEPIVFRRWSNKKYAVLATFHKVIRIATLSLACSLVQLQPLLAQSDTAAPAIHYELEEVETVTQQEADLYSPVLRQLLTIRQEKLEISSPRSLPDLLDHYPGVDIRTRGVHGVQSDLSIQGGSFDQSLVLLNGIDMTNPQTGHFSLDLPLDPAIANRLEILKGPASKKYGFAAYTGAVNVITAPADSLDVQVHAAYGQHNTYQSGAAIHLPAGVTRTMVAASASGSNGYMENTDYSMANVYLHSTASTDWLKSDLILGWNRKNFGANAFYTPRFPDQYEATRALTGALKMKGGKRAFKVSAQVHWNRHFDHFLLFRDNPAAYENYHRTDVTGLAMGASYSSSLGFTSLKLQHRNDRILSTSLGDPLDRPVPVGYAEGKEYLRSKKRDHLYLSADHLLQVGQLYLNAGVLVHAGIRDLSPPGLYPGLDVSYRFSDRISMFASTNRSMRLPTFTDLYYEGPQNRGNPDLRPETAITLETGTRISGRGYRADAAIFFRKGNASIDWIWTDSVWQTRNLTELNTYGGEMNFWLLPGQIGAAPGWVKHFRISYSYTELNKPSDAYISNYALDNLRHKATLDLRILLPLHMYFDTRVLWQDRNGSFLYYETPSSTPYETAYDPYWLTDITVGITFGKIDLYISATNLLDVSYRDIGSVEMPGRWFMTGVRFR
ncbi:MAG: TonB-dependent receptor [Bacteroidales bacterium]|nr:TonB-dependent receptor [Bacteroidales bacterium]MDT8431788.1 TonB-dependent receptor [Bacteroidales bacterium]